MTHKPSQVVLQEVTNIAHVLPLLRSGPVDNAGTKTVCALEGLPERGEVGRAEHARRTKRHPVHEFAAFILIRQEGLHGDGGVKNSVRGPLPECRQHSAMHSDAVPQVRGCVGYECECVDESLPFDGRHMKTPKWRCAKRCLRAFEFVGGRDQWPPYQEGVPWNWKVRKPHGYLQLPHDILDVGVADRPPPERPR